MIQDHIIASCHMLDAYNSGAEWACACGPCAETRKNQPLVDAILVEIRKNPADPNARPSPLFVNV